MWRHEAGRIDFDEPLSQLLLRGWGFREFAPIAGVRDGGCWAVVGVHGGDRVRVDRSERREAWGEAVGLALLAAPLPGSVRAPTEGATACDEERIRLREADWSFTEHLTPQAGGRVGWVVRGTRDGRTILVADDDRSDAWGTALILAAVTGAGGSGGPPEPPVPDGVG
jgi:hypothetical protein